MNMTPHVQLARSINPVCARARLTQRLLAVSALLLFSVSARAQISLTTAVDLALTHSPRIRAAQAEVDKAKASLDESRDVYIPTVVAGAGLGQSYGYSFNPPTLFTFNSQSLFFNWSQRDYVRSSRLGLSAAGFTLLDTRQAVAEDTTLSYLAVQHDQQRESVLQQQIDLANKLARIVEDRFNAGRDTAIDLTQARLLGAQYRLSFLQAQDDTARDQNHLALLLGFAPGVVLRAEDAFPPLPVDTPSLASSSIAASPAIAAAYANADAKQHAAHGDARYLYRPQFTLVAQYNRYATFTSSFGTISNGRPIGANEGAFGVQITLPLLDRGHQARFRESAADAAHALAEADDAQRTAVDSQLKLRHSLAVLRARTEVAQLDQQLAQQQLDALTTQLNTASTNPNSPLLTPKDEQNSRLTEREKYLALIDSNYQLHQAQLQLLRQTGQLETWLRQVAIQPTGIP